MAEVSAKGKGSPAERIAVTCARHPDALRLAKLDDVSDFQPLGGGVVCGPTPHILMVLCCQTVCV